MNEMIDITREGFYVCEMLREKRVVSITENGKIKAMIFFSLCDDEKEHLWNLEYEFRPHNPKGKILIIEAMAGKSFSFSLLKKLKEIFYTKFPQIEKTMWRRDNYLGAKVYTLTRRNYVAQH